MAQVTVTLNLDLASLEEEIKHGAVRQEAKAIAMSLPEVRDAIRKEVESTAPGVFAQAVKEAAQQEVAGVMRGVLSEYRKQLEQCMADYGQWFAQHANEYANRQKAALKKFLDAH